MKKLYLFALKDERDAFLKGLHKDAQAADFFHEDDCAYGIIGVGKVNAAMNTETYIQTMKPDLVINVGVAGGIDKATDTWVLVEETLFYDVDVTAFGYEKGQYPKSQPSFLASSSHLKTLKKAFENKSYSLGLVATGDQFLTTEAPLKDFKSISAVDMELAAIALVCEKNSVPWVSIKTISDTVGTPSQIEDFDRWVQEGLKKVAPLIEGAFQ